MIESEFQDRQHTRAESVVKLGSIHLVAVLINLIDAALSHIPVRAGEEQPFISLAISSVQGKQM